MTTTPAPTDDETTWRRRFASRANNRGWALAEQATRTPAEDDEMLHAAHAAAHLWQPIATDRQSQAMINGAFAYTQLMPTAAVQFKTDSGFVSLNAPQIQAIAVAVAEHVQACFAAEATLGAGIAGGTVTTLAAIDAAFVGK